MFSKIEINREMVYSGIIFIIGSILFTQASVISEKSDKETRKSIKEDEQIKSAMILFVAFLLFLIGSVWYFDAASKRLAQNQEELMTYRYTNLPIAANTLAYFGSGVLLFSIIILVLSGLLRITEVTQSNY